MPTVCAEDQSLDWFESLRRCLHWNERVRQKGLNESPPVAALEEALYGPSERDRSSHDGRTPSVLVNSASSDKSSPPRPYVSEALPDGVLPTDLMSASIISSSTQSATNDRRGGEDDNE